MRNDAAHAPRTGERSLLSSVIDQIPDEIMILDHRATVVDINSALADRLGGSRGDFLGRPCREAAIPGFDGICGSGGDAGLWESALAGVKSERVQSEVDGEGRMRYARVSVYPVTDGPEGLTHVLVMRRDITQRTHMERRLQQSEKLAAVGELSTYVAHEIRNPLFAIAGFANALLRSGTLDEKARSKVAVILEESNRLDKIVKSLLNFTRPTQGIAGQVDLARIVPETMELMGLGCQKQGVEVILEIAPGLPMAKGDPELIKQCVINMAKNAMEAMPEGGRLTVSCFLRGEMAVLQMRDTGTGIAPEHLEQVFNPFFSTKGKGSGLGLAMTKKILDEIGGTVELESEAGAGATVRLVMPPQMAAEDVDVSGQAAPRHDGLWIRGGAGPDGGDGPDPGKQGA